MLILVNAAASAVVNSSSVSPNRDTFSEIVWLQGRLLDISHYPPGVDLQDSTNEQKINHIEAAFAQFIL